MKDGSVASASGVAGERPDVNRQATVIVAGDLRPLNASRLGTSRLGVCSSMGRTEIGELVEQVRVRPGEVAGDPTHRQ